VLLSCFKDNVRFAQLQSLWINTIMKVRMTNWNLKEVVLLVSSRLSDFQGPCMWTKLLGLRTSRIKQCQRQGILMASMAMAKSKVSEALTSMVPELSLKVAGLFGLFLGLKFELFDCWVDCYFLNSINYLELSGRILFIGYLELIIFCN